MNDIFHQQRVHPNKIKMYKEIIDSQRNQMQSSSYQTTYEESNIQRFPHWLLVDNAGIYWKTDNILCKTNHCYFISEPAGSVGG